ncbi:MAG: outer rane efflux protein [Bacteroidetes bacterium]|nr:outer rane efflux protein [Bacteroidota bacterium]
MKRLTLILLSITSIGFAQNPTLSLDSCIQMAKRNYPLIKQNNLIAENEKNNIKSDNKNWLPKAQFISKATYQSEVIEFLGTTFPHDSYITAIDAEETLFDGGQTKNQKNVDKLNAETDLLKNQVELYKLIDRVNQLYSNILLTRENINTLNVYKDDINNKRTILSASVKNGMMLQSNLDGLEAEELKTEQSLLEAKDNLQALYFSLGQFVNKTIDDNTQLSTDPIMSLSKGEEINRPELKLFDTQKNLLDARHKLNNNAAMPRLTIGGEGAYGRPGPNFLNQDFRFFAQANVSLKWNIGSLYNLNNEKQNISINKQMVDVQREVFEFNLKSTLATQTAQINSLKEIIEKDKQIIEKRHSIKETAARQLENGSITTTDYLTELNAEMQATLNQKVHEIKLMNAITNYNSTKGINNF